MCLEHIVVGVPEVNRVVVRCSRYELEVSVRHLAVVGCDEGAAVVKLLTLGYSLDHFTISSIIDFKGLGVFLTDQQLLKFFEVEHVLNLCVMLSILDVTGVVTFDSIDEVAVLSHHSKFNNVVSELDPL